MLDNLTPIPATAPRPGQTWRHFKGHDCFVLYVGHHTETGELLVIYREHTSRGIFCRPLAMWADEARPHIQRFFLLYDVAEF